LIALTAAACLLALAGTAQAAPPAGEDQYLEQVPNAGGKSGPGAGSDYAQSVGGENGQVTEEDVKRAAEKNKKNAKGQTGATGATAPGATAPTSAAPVESVATAAKIGPFSRSAALAILAIILAIGGAALYQRSRNSGGPGTGTGAGTGPGPDAGPGPGGPTPQ
jgi:hypothetical protein